jgi:hypothetical protein
MEPLHAEIGVRGSDDLTGAAEPVEGQLLRR